MINTDLFLQKYSRFFLRVAFLGILFFTFPFSVFAADAVSVFVGNITKFIIQPVIFFVFALAMYYFVVGLLPFILKSDDPEARKVGRGHLIWGIVGFFIMTSVVTILAVITNTFCDQTFCTGASVLP